MLNLFGNPGKSKEEIEIQQLKKSFNEAIASLNKSIESTGSKSDIKKISAQVRGRIKTFDIGCKSLFKRMKTIEQHVKNKELLIKNVNTKIIAMSIILGHANEVIGEENKIESTENL